ncbi:hypothetical protein [Cetobacterium sp.]|uniref:hypothetical protein n=1 Tax=Cetobacterium sp. TaxID=2071632 RepID=UPI002FCC3531
MKKLIKIFERIELKNQLYVGVWIGIIIVQGAFIFNIQKIFPPKYFFDSNHIVKLINYNLYSTVDQSYKVTAKLFSLLNLKILSDYNMVLYIIFLIFFIPYLYKYYNKKLKISILNMIYLFLSSVYLIRPGKEFLQFLILMFCFKWTKYSSVFLILGGLIFRKYLILQGLIFIFIQIYKNTTRKNKKKLRIIYFLGILIVSILFKGLVTEILGSRMGVNQWRENDLNAATIINDIIQSKGMIFLYINYFINTMRLLFPIELILKSIKYSPYVLFQFWFTVKLYKWRFKKNDKVYLLYSFIIVSGFFEPDYGSFLRHTVPYFIFIIELNFKEKR